MREIDERADALSGADVDVSLLAKDQYFRELAWMEPLGDEEREMLLQCVVRGNVERRSSSPNPSVLALAKDARERLAQAYQPLIVGMARRRVFMFKSMELLDVIQEGNVAFAEALNLYDEELARVADFKAVVITRVKFAMAEAARSTDAFIRGTWRIHDVVIRKGEVESELSEQLGRQPLVSEIAAVMQIPEDKLLHALLLAKREEVVSLHQLTENMERAEDTLTFTQLYAAAVVSEDERQQQLAATFERVFAEGVTDKQRQVLELRYGFGEDSTTMRPANVVREMLGYERTGNVNSHEKAALERLRKIISPVTLSDGRLSCRFEVGPSASSRSGFSRPVVQSEDEEYCTTQEAADLLGVSTAAIDALVKRGVLSRELRVCAQVGGRKVRFIKKVDVLAVQHKRATAPIPIASRRRENVSLKQARRSAALPAIVA